VSEETQKPPMKAVSAEDVYE